MGRVSDVWNGSFVVNRLVLGSGGIVVPVAGELDAGWYLLMSTGAIVHDLTLRCACLDSVVLILPS